MRPLLKFYRQLKQSLFVHDVYASMFFCDFINMIIVIGFYSQFGVSDETTSSRLYTPSLPVDNYSTGNRSISSLF